MSELSLLDLLRTLYQKIEDNRSIGNWSAVRDLLILACKIEPSNRQLLPALGAVQFELGEYAEALESFRKAAIESQEQELQLQIATALMKMTRFSEAKAEVIDILSKEPKNKAAGDLLRQVDAEWMAVRVQQHEKAVAQFHLPLPKAIERGVATVGRWSYGFPTVKWWGEDARLKIGSFCSIADGVTIVLGGEHETRWVSTFPFNSPEHRSIFDPKGQIKGAAHTKGDVVIGNDVWISTGATLLSGVTIGDGAVVAAHAVVTKDIEPYTIVGGVPAKPIRKRFSGEHIAALIELKWWDFSDERIAALARFLSSDDVDEFLRVARQKETSG